MPTTCLIDAHVHFYDCYDRTRFFDGAADNFQAAARRLGLSGPAETWLLFSESAGDRYFRQFKAEADGPAADAAWQFVSTEEPGSVRAVRTDGAALALIAGRQIVTRERLEVLALGADADIDDGQPLAATLDAARAAGAVAVLPWAFGKWWGGRGAHVAAALQAAGPGTLYLGDNGGRPWILPSRLLARGEARGIPVLPGSDPLPLAAEAGAAARIGFVLEDEIDPTRPAASFKTWLSRQTGPLARFGRQQSLTRFCMNQVALRLAG